MSEVLSENADECDDFESPDEPFTSTPASAPAESRLGKWEALRDHFC
jgi:hypothetical protein